MKPREFWLSIGSKDPIYTKRPNMLDDRGDYPPCKAIHVREVVPIDWGKIESDYHNSTKEQLRIFTIKQLVEKQLRGEE